MKRYLLCFILGIAGTTVGAQTLFNPPTSITDTLLRIDEVTVLQNKSRVRLLGMDVPIKDLPMTVTTLSSEVIDRKAILKLEDAVRFLPGVTVSDQLGAFQRYSIRGTSDAIIAFDGIRDERTLLSTMPFPDLSSVESIEVIKGPASVLAGHSVMGGVINIVRKRASREFTANARLDCGSWQQKRASMGFGGKLSGPVNYYANFHFSNEQGYRKVGSDCASAMINLDSRIGRNGFLNTSFIINDDKYTTEIGSAPLMPGDIFTKDGDKAFAKNQDRNPLADYRTVYNDLANNKMHRKSWEANADYSHRIGEHMEIRNRFTYVFSDHDYSCIEKMAYQTSSEGIYDWYYVNKEEKVYIRLDSLQSGYPLVFNPEDYAITNTLELNGQFRTGSLKHRYTGGWSTSFFDYTNYTGYKDGDVWGPGVYQVVSVKNPQLVRDWWDSKVSAASIRHQITHGIYFVDVIDIDEQWKAMIGGRFDTYKYKSASAAIDDGRQRYSKKNRSEWNQVKADAFTYRAGVVYNPSQIVTLYASGANYFKPNNTFYNEDYIYLDRNGNEFFPEDGGRVFDPEKGHQVEIGVRVNLNPRFELNASVFYINKYNTVKNLGTKDVQQNGAVVSKSIRGQVGRSDSQGCDLEAVYRPLRTLQLTGGFGYQDARIRKIARSSEFEGFSEATTNQRATNIPRTTAFLYADYTIPAGLFKNVSFHLSGTYQDRIYRSIADHTYFPELFLVDAGVYYTTKNNITFSVVINNLFDKEYFTKITTLGKPVNYMFSLSYRFR